MKYLIGLLCSIITISAKTQVSVATYHYTHMYDTVGKRSASDNTMLIFSAEKSIYLSLTRYLHDSAYQAALKAGTSELPPPSTSSTTKLYYNFSTNEGSLIWLWMNDTFLVQEGLSKIDWTLMPEQKIIGGFLSHKAVGRFKGRLYTAWYAPEIAVQAGPNKLQGLPGLILEAQDSTGTVKFEFTGLHSRPTQQCLCTPGKAPLISKAKRAEMQAGMGKETDQQTAQRLSTQMNLGPGVTLTVQSSDNIIPKVQLSKPVINNPVELVPE